jgi:3-(3-hydroxy-phenyl)propionate hydroxylase
MSIPAPQGGRRYEFKMLPGESAEQMRTFPSIQRMLSPLRNVRPEDLVRAAVYRFEAKIAERLAAGRILLLGDAAHLTPPFAGQGMNAGLRDAVNLAWKIAMVVRQEAHPELLLSYEAERRDPIWAMIQLAVTMGDFIMPRCETDRRLRAGLLEKLSGHPGAIEYLVGMKFKPRARYTAGAFLGLQPGNVPASLVGSMIPQPRVRSAGEAVLLDELIGANFSILVQSRELAAFAREQSRYLWPELKPAIITLLESNPKAPWPDSDSVIEEPEVAFPLRAHRDQLLLVRPDRFAAVAFWPAQMREVVDEFRTVLHSTVPR